MVPPGSVFLIAACVALVPLRAQAQWWSRAPADFEECADAAEKAATKEDQGVGSSPNATRNSPAAASPAAATPISISCRTGASISRARTRRRKSRRRSTSNIPRFLDQERRSRIAAAFAAKQQQLQQHLQAYVRSKPRKVPLPVAAPNKPRPAASDIRPRPKAANCARHSFSCDWPLLSETPQ